MLTPRFSRSGASHFLQKKFPILTPRSRTRRSARILRAVREHPARSFRAAHEPTVQVTLGALILLIGLALPTFAQKKHVPPGGNIAVVADERLAALRVAPSLSARLIRRLGRGKLVSVRGATRNREGVLFSHVVVTRRTSGWVQSEALVSSSRNGDDQRLAHLIGGTDEFERIARARIFLETFPRSPLRARVLLALGDAAEEAAEQLTREATRRFERREIPTDGAPEFSYYMNYNGLDRYNRQSVTFTFDRATKRFHYDGAAWREIVRKYPDSPDASEAKKRLAVLGD